jgi:cystathionine gamma-lyase
VGELEGGEAVLFSSGMGAAAAILLPALRGGDVLVVPRDCYPTVRAMAVEHLRPRGVEVRLVENDTSVLCEAAQGATLVWAETPGNPSLAIIDLDKLAGATRAHGALLAVDNTLATPLAQRPLELGAHFSMTSATKYMSGHSDLLLGYVATSEPDRAAALRTWRTRTGAIAGPFETWLAHRSLATLDVRLERQCATALALAEMLAARDDVTDVRYPGLPGSPGYEVAGRQMAGRFGSVVCFTVDGEDRAERFLAACELVADATSFGSVHSTAERRARWGNDDVASGFIRFSAGLEDAGDLLADVGQALDASRG